MVRVIGPQVIPEKILSEPIRKQAACCWSNTFKQGLPKDYLEKIASKYPPTSNFADIEPPTLNFGIEKLLIKVNLESVIKRDDRISEKQLKLKASLAAVGKVLN